MPVYVHNVNVFLFACVCLRFQRRRQTISGSVPHPLPCLIGQTDQSERGLVVPTMRPCVRWAWAWGGQCETTTRYSTSLQQRFSSSLSDTKVAEFDPQPQKASTYYRKAHSTLSGAEITPINRLIAVLKPAAAAAAEVWMKRCGATCLTPKWSTCQPEQVYVWLPGSVLHKHNTDIRHQQLISSLHPPRSRMSVSYNKKGVKAQNCPSRFD